MFEGAWKLFQRKLYSWLSSKCGLPVCIVGLLLVLISAFQFGEVFLEWSKEKYAAQFSIYADNIAGKSFERYLCPELPIDIVYTWVNGSDPELLRQLRELKKQLPKKKSNDTTTGSQVNSTNTTSLNHLNSTNATPSSSGDRAELKCPFKDCVPWRSLVLDSRNITGSLNLDSLRTSFPVLGVTPSDCRLIVPEGDHVTSVYTVRLPKERDVTKLIQKGFITDSSGRNVSATRGYLTSDHSLVGAVKMDDFAIAVSSGIRPLNNSKLFRKWMEAHFGRDVLEAEVKRNNTAVVRFRPGKLAGILKTINSSYQFSGESVSLSQAYLMWLPFSLPAAAWEEELERADIISANRFQDNEELRYSLRSVEQFAPWVRQIFIVTNGQIPSWLNLDNPRLTIVTHKDIFVNQSHLPTYSSPAIESHLHRIPGLSKNFLYLNDDVMFGDDVFPEDFYTLRRGQKVFLAWAVPHCAEGCPPNWITDKYCDTACNNSACDWDGGDCVNATKPGWTHGFSWNTNRGTVDHCGTGCLNSWLGDRYCDSSCRIPQCGYDAGDCGTENWNELLSYTLPEGGARYNVPLSTKALYFNLTDVFPNGTTITSGEFGSAPIIRTSVISQKFKTLSLTLSSNTSRSLVNFTLRGKHQNDTGHEIVVNFTISCDTQTANKTVENSTVDVFWNFNFNETNSKKFLEAVAIRIQDAKRSINYWVTERPSSSPTPPPPTAFTNYTISNMSHLPENISVALRELDHDYHDGDLTQKGYMKKRAILLEPFKTLVSVNGTVSFGVDPVGVGEGQGVQVPVGGARKLLSLTAVDEGEEGTEIEVEEHHLAEKVAIAKRKELNRDRDLKKALDDWEKKYGAWDPSFKPWESHRRLPWEKLRIFPEDDGNAAAATENMAAAGPADMYRTGSYRSRRLMADDTFADSLRHVNRIFTKAYGHEARKVPAHMPHFIQSDVMRALQAKFPDEFEKTSSHKVRMADDMQYAFSYYYFLMSEKKELNVPAAFEKLDTDKSGILSVRELRTMLAMFSDLPIDLEDVRNFENLLRSCDKEYNGTRPSISPVEYDTHYDPDLPLVTLDFTLQCQPLIEKINKTMTSQTKYEFEEAPYDYVAFKMISENTSKVMEELDTIRKERKKFICLNDNINHDKEGAELAKLILLDFYESLFPVPSQFELPPEYRNRFLHVGELNEWLQFRNTIQLVLHLACGILIVLCVVSLFYGKLIQLKRKLSRFLSSTLSFGRTRSSV